jgi:hypothetical protein
MLRNTCNSAQASHFHTSFSFQRVHLIATLLSAQQAHFQMAAIFQKHFRLHFYISMHHASLYTMHASLHLHHHVIDSQALAP